MCGHEWFEPEYFRQLQSSLNHSRVHSLLWSEQSRHGAIGRSSGQSVSSMGDRQQGGVPALKQDFVQRAVSVGVMRICVDLPLQCGASQNLEKEFSKI